jgi:heme/copper-type cytochrome/quinol oxidase subunit 2
MLVMMSMMMMMIIMIMVVVVMVVAVMMVVAIKIRFRNWGRWRSTQASTKRMLEKWREADLLYFAKYTVI